MRTKPTIPEVLPLIRDYARANPVGGSVHCVVDDGNFRDHDVDFCIQWAIEKGDAEGELVARILRMMSWTQRKKISAMWHAL